MESASLNSRMMPDGTRQPVLKPGPLHLLSPHPLPRSARAMMKDREELAAQAHQAYADLLAQAMSVCVMFGEAGEDAPSPLYRLLGNKATSFNDIGRQFRDARRATGKTLREFCIEHNLDAATCSRIERGLPNLTDEEVASKLPALPVVDAEHADELVEAIRVS